MSKTTKKVKRRVNSRQRGKVGERLAAAYLRSLGFESAKRGQQHRGGPDSPDILVPDELPHIHFEVKHRKAIGLGTKELDVAYVQADSEAPSGSEAVVVWKTKGSQVGWSLTWNERGIQLTTNGDTEIKTTLERLNAERS